MAAAAPTSSVTSCGWGDVKLTVRHCYTILSRDSSHRLTFRLSSAKVAAPVLRQVSSSYTHTNTHPYTHHPSISLSLSLSSHRPLPLLLTAPACSPPPPRQCGSRPTAAEQGSHSVCAFAGADSSDGGGGGGDGGDGGDGGGSDAHSAAGAHGGGGARGGGGRRTGARLGEKASLLLLPLVRAAPPFPS